MFRPVLPVILILTLTSFADAQSQQFPYQAKISVAEVYARSGGGEAFYPTQQLTQGTVVTVRRHDAGGWYMIDPPEGSFSWIPTKYVRETGGGAGEVLESNAVVFVGSSFGDETSVWQRRMSAGEAVTILSEREVDTLSGPKKMYKIAPPQREYRWIPGTSVLPVSEADRARHDRNPYNVPSQIVQQRHQQRSAPGPATDAPSPTSGNSGSAGESSFSPSRNLARLKQIRAEQRDLHALDQRFREMILSSPSEWKLNEIEREYQELQDKATHKPIAGQIDLRYPAIRRYEQRKAELDDLERLTSQTEKTDAELMASQYGVGQSSGMLAADGQMLTDGAMLPRQRLFSNGQMTTDQSLSVSPEQFAGVASFSGQPQMGFDQFGPVPGQGLMTSSEMNASSINGTVMHIPGPQAFDQSFDSSGAALPSGQTFPASHSAAGSAQNSRSATSGDFGLTVPAFTGQASTTSQQSAYIGAGFLQRATGDSPDAYVLISPAGKVLAHVQPEGDVQLEQFLGESVGLRGSRYYDDKVRTDRIHVTSLEPVRIR